MSLACHQLCTLKLEEGNFEWDGNSKSKESLRKLQGYAMLEGWIDTTTLYFKAFVVASTVFTFYWAKEIMELLLLNVFGVDRRMMYIPVPQNTRTDLPFMSGNLRRYERGELYYFIYHSIMSLCLAITAFVITIFTPPSPF